MDLERLALLSVFKFMASAINQSDYNSSDCALHVRVENGVCIFTSGYGGIFKRTKLTVQNTTTTPVEEVKDQKFLIPYGVMSSFKTMMKEDKKKAKKLKKGDSNFLHVFLSPDCLESFDSQVTYEQPKYPYKDIENEFNIKRELTINNLPFIPKNLATALEGFDSGKITEFNVCGDNQTIYLFQESTGFEALILPAVKEKEKDPKKSGQKKKF